MLQRSSHTYVTARRPLPAARSVTAAFRGLRRMGWSEGEAASLAAHLAGLTANRRGWRIDEIERLLFIRALVERGRFLP